MHSLNLARRLSITRALIRCSCRTGVLLQGFGEASFRIGSRHVERVSPSRP